MSDDRPALRIVRGDPTAEEIAVVTALVSVSAGDGGGEETPRERRGGWNDPSWQFRRQLYSGPNGWRGSLR